MGVWERVQYCNYCIPGNQFEGSSSKTQTLGHVPQSVVRYRTYMLCNKSVIKGDLNHTRHSNLNIVKYVSTAPYPDQRGGKKRRSVSVSMRDGKTLDIRRHEHSQRDSCTPTVVGSKSTVNT